MHHVAPKCVSLHVSEGEVVEWKLGTGWRGGGTGWSATVEWALLLRCGTPWDVVECGYEHHLSNWAPDIPDGESSIHVMPLFGPWSCTNLESTVEKAWRCVSWPFPMDWWGGTWSATLASAMVGPGGTSKWPTLLQLLLVAWFLVFLYSFPARAKISKYKWKYVNYKHKSLLVVLFPPIVGAMLMVKIGI